MIEQTPLPFFRNNGGFEASGIKDTNNCTVIGFAIVTGVDYHTADLIAVKTKRKRRQGHWPAKMVAYAKRVYGMRFKKFKFSSMTIQKFIKTYPIGRYYVSTNKHCFAIIDGVVNDHSNMNKRFGIIKDAWQFVYKAI